MPSVSSRLGSSSSSRSQRAASGTSAGLSAWDLAVAESRRKKLEATGAEADKAPREATLLIVGTRGAGKTSLVQRFLDRDEAPRQTLALEYTYGRKSGRTLVKDVCHLWELGGGSLFTQLLGTAITGRTLSHLALVLVLDLSQPHTLWADLEALLPALKGQVDKAADSVPGLRQTLEAAAAKRLNIDLKEEGVEPWLVPLVIMGGKYDIFQDMEPENKKLVCRALRFVAHTNGASLQFFSAKDAGLTKKAKELLSHFAFNTTESHSLAQDYNKPLIIPAGSDSQATISPGEQLSLEAWSHIFTTRFPQEAHQSSSHMPEDPAKDPTYAEPEIDNLRAQKDEELERIRREVGHSSARWAELDLS